MDTRQSKKQHKNIMRQQLLSLLTFLSTKESVEIKSVVNEDKTRILPRHNHDIQQEIEEAGRNLTRKGLLKL